MTSNGVTTSFTYDARGRMAQKNATIGGTPRVASPAPHLKTPVLERGRNQGDSNQLLASGVFLIAILPAGPFLFVFAAFGPPSGKGADAAAKVGLHLAQKGVVTKGAAGPRMQA